MSRFRLPPRSQWPIPGVRPPWAELGGWGKVRRVVFWLSMLGNVGLIASAETSGSDLNIQADGTKRKKTDEAPDFKGAPPQREQAGEDPADEKRDEPEQQEGRASEPAS